MSDAREPASEYEEIIRRHWPQIARMGRHGYALSRTSMLGVVWLVGWGLVDANSLASLFRGGFTDATAWALALGVPILAGVYRLCLARYDQDAALYGGGRRSLDQWRASADEGSGPPTRPSM